MYSPKKAMWPQIPVPGLSRLFPGQRTAAYRPQNPGIVSRPQYG